MLKDRRIALSCGEGKTNSIKYKLVSQEDQVEFIDNDYKSLYGDIIASQDEPTLLQFWLKALALGGVFGYSAVDLKNNVNIISQKSGPVERAFSNLPEDKRAIIDKNKFTLFIAKPKRKLDTKTKEQLEHDFLRMLKDPAHPDEAMHQLATKYATTITDIPYKLHSEFIAGLFGVDVEQTEKSAITLTFVFLPRFMNIPQLESSTEEIDYILQTHADIYQQATGSPIDPKAALHFIGIGSNGNALYGLLHTIFSSLASKRGEKLADYQHDLLDAMDTAIGYSADERKAVLRCIEELTEVAQSIGLPKFVASWAEYRSDISGKLQSWFSNRERMKRQLASQVERIKEDIAKIQQDLQLVVDNPIGLIDNLTVIARLLKANDMSFSKTSLMEATLSDILVAANAWYQEFWPEIRTAKKLKMRKYDRKKYLPSFDNRIQSLPKFFGEQKPEQFARLKNTKRLLLGYQQDMITLGDKLAVSVRQADNLEPKDIERFLSWTRKTASLRNSRATGNKIALYLGLGFRQLEKNQHYWVSPFYKSSAVNIIPCPDITSNQLAGIWQICRNWLTSIAIEPVNYDELVEMNELWRRLAAILISYQKTPSPITKEELQASLSLPSRDFLGFFDSLTPVALQRLTQTHIGSNFKGLLAPFSRQTIKAVSFLQAQNGEQCAVLMDTENDQFKLQLNTPELVIEPLDEEELKNPKLITINKSTAKIRYSTQRFQPLKGPILHIITSPRDNQYQYLWSFTHKTKRKYTDLKMGGSFIMVERTYKLDWTGDQPQLVRAKSEMFVSIPFTFLPPEQAKTPTSFIPGSGIPFGDDRYMGIRQGELSVQYEIIQVRAKQYWTLAAGTIHDSRFKSLALAVDRRRQEQIRGTYSMPSHRVMRLREQLVGRLRSKIDSLALKYNAKIVYGANRISPEMDRVYTAVQRGNAWPDLSDVTRAAHVASWGKTTLQPGLLIRTGAVEETCDRCKRRFRSLIDKEQSEYQLEKLPGQSAIRVVKLGDRRLYVLSDRESLKPYELSLAIRRFMFPLEDSPVMEFAHVSLKKNAPVFVCPFADCNYATNSSKQAAGNIALLGAIKDQVEKGEKVEYESAVRAYKRIEKV